MIWLALLLTGIIVGIVSGIGSAASYFTGSEEHTPLSRSFLVFTFLGIATIIVAIWYGILSGEWSGGK